MKNRILLPTIAAVACSVTGASSAQSRENTSSYQALMNCRSIADTTERLACYDSKAAALERAEKTGDVVIADREQLRETSKGLFGFGALKLPIIGTRSNLETPEQIEAKITGLRSLGYGKWEMTLDNGMHWRTSEPGSNDPAIGDPVVIRSGAFTNFFIRVRGARGVRGLRVR
jgi:hypothetical protein